MIMSSDTQDEYDGNWSAQSTMIRPIEQPTYKDVFDIPDGAEVVFIGDGAYNCIQMVDEAREAMRKRLAEAGFADTPEEVLIADFVMWIHPDDMAEHKRAAMAATVDEARGQ
jgi:hypothetical protein